MAVDVRIIPIKEFLRSDVSGNLDLERSLIILLNLVEECKKHNVDRILLDTREATSNASMVGHLPPTNRARKVSKKLQK